jgi:hypothetical protein
VIGSVQVGSVLTRVALLADDPPAEVDPTTGKGPEWGKAAPIGLLIILLMGIALYFLIRSMNKNLRKVPSSFDTDSAVPDDFADDFPDERTSDGAEDVQQAGSPSDDGTDPDANEPLAGSAADRVERPR